MFLWEKQTNEQKLTDTKTTVWWLQEGEGGEGSSKCEGVKYTVTEGGFTLGGKHTM